MLLCDKPNVQLFDYLTKPCLCGLASDFPKLSFLLSSQFLNSKARADAWAKGSKSTHFQLRHPFSAPSHSRSLSLAFPICVWTH